MSNIRIDNVPSVDEVAEKVEGEAMKAAVETSEKPATRKIGFWQYLTKSLDGKGDVELPSKWIVAYVVYWLISLFTVALVVRLFSGVFNQGIGWLFDSLFDLFEVQHNKFAHDVYWLVMLIIKWPFFFMLVYIMLLGKKILIERILVYYGDSSLVKVGLYVASWLELMIAMWILVRRNHAYFNHTTFIDFFRPYALTSVLVIAGISLVLGMWGLVRKIGGQYGE